MFEHEHIYVFPQRPKAGVLYERFRNTWFLKRRHKPLVPCPENTPLPNSKMESEKRSKIFSLYLRAWTLVEDESSVEVPFIKDLTLTAAQWKGKKNRRSRCRCTHSEVMQIQMMLHNRRSTRSAELGKIILHECPLRPFAKLEIS